MSVHLQLLLTEQLGLMEETQGLLFDLLIQQSGSECHLDHTSLSPRRDVRNYSDLEDPEVTLVIIVCCIIHIYRKC